jgi:hypothetical protein
MAIFLDMLSNQSNKEFYLKQRFKCETDHNTLLLIFFTN